MRSSRAGSLSERRSDAVVVRDGTAGPALVAYVVPRAGAKLTATDLREFLAARLPRLHGAGVVRRDAHGAADDRQRKARPRGLAGAGQGQSAAQCAEARRRRCGIGHSADKPISKFEQKISAIVASLLEQPSVGRGDNFFMLGGHSMLGVQLVARDSRAFGVEADTSTTLSRATVDALSAEVARLASAAAATSGAGSPRP